MRISDWSSDVCSSDLVYSLRFGYDIFFGEPSTDLPRTPHEAPRWMRAPVLLLVITRLIVGIIPGLSIGPALAAAARPVVGGELLIYSLELGSAHVCTQATNAHPVCRILLVTKT